KIAGTVALPLALAIASAASAATVVDTDAHRLQIGGFVAAQGIWSMPDEGDGDFSMGLSTTRLNVNYTAKTDAGDVRVMYENDYVGGGYRLRHAAIFHDGWVAGQTWSFASNLVGLAETVEQNGNAVRSAFTARNAVLGKVFSLADGMTVGVSLEDKAQSTESMVPDLTANFTGKFGDTTVFAAGQMVQVADDSEMRLTFGLAQQLGNQMKLNAAFTSYIDDAWLSVGGQFKVNDQVRTNLVVEQSMMDADDADYTAIWVNAFYKMASGLEWGAELGMVSGDVGADEQAAALAGGMTQDEINAYLPALGTGGKLDGDMTFRLQAKYAF
ncbi:MAG: hypothetical protein IBX50_20095, partial [Marinospirillum sp.]|nr:hypothetical protein [Marinospirillum sp.]